MFEKLFNKAFPHDPGPHWDAVAYLLAGAAYCTWLGVRQIAKGFPVPAVVAIPMALLLAYMAKEEALGHFNDPGET